jgi:sigma-E factor negative regulatory protein RseA
MNESAESALPSGLPADERDALMSALADGEGHALAAACALWRDDAQARATWHAYHLIGDVLRSEDLASPARHDAAFLAAVRARLADEPVVLAPPQSERAATARRSWWAPAAVAAGFVAVAGVLVVTRLSNPEAPVLAATPNATMNALGTAPAPGFSLASTNAPIASAPPMVIEGRLIRNAGLDSYLRAHREGLGGVPAAVPGGLPRSVETLAPMPVSAAVER